jgi:hypothetical protein
VKKVLLIYKAPLADLFDLPLHLSACPYPSLPGQVIPHLFSLPPLGVPLLHIFKTLLVPLNCRKKFIYLCIQGINGFLLVIFDLKQIGVFLLDLVHIVLKIFQLTLYSL